MKLKFRWLCVLLMTMCANMALAESPADNPVQALLFSPEVLIHHRQEIGLSDEQVERIHARLEEAGPGAQEQQMRVNKAMGQLAELLSAEKVDEEAALKQLDEVLVIEKEQKQLHLRLMIQIRNELNPEQRKIAATINRSPQSTAGLEQRLQAKVARIEKEVQRRAEAGQPPFDVVGLMQKFPELMQNGQVEEAEALLDRVSAMLGLNRPERAPGKPQPADPLRQLAAKIQQVQQGAEKMQQNGKDVSQIQDLMDKVGPLLQQGKAAEAEKLVDEVLKLINKGAALDNKPSKSRDEVRSKSPDEVRSEVNALKKEDVAWRHIAWKTCLLDGLKSSREQNKPIMLWVFIDRPIDDERC